MTTAVASPFDFSEVIKNNKMLNYKNNILTGPHGLSVPCSSANMPSSTLLDRKAVGTPTSSMYQRRHSVSLPSSSRLNHNQFFNAAKPSDMALLNAGLVGHGVGSGNSNSSSNSSSNSIIIINNNNNSSNNKENRLRERSFSETGERLLHKGAAGLPFKPLPTSPSSTSNGNGPCLALPTGQVNSSRYKTELCRPFEENGSCKYGDKCQFAHGAHELRSLSRHPKYKTELCRTFHTIGFCPYGPRCHFIHNAEERRGLPSAPISPLSASNGKLERPRLHHSFSFAGFPSTGCASSTTLSLCTSSAESTGSYLRDSPTSLTPPPIFPAEEDIPEWPNTNPFTFSGQKLANIFCPSLSLPTGDATPTAAAPGAPPPSLGQAPPSPTGSDGCPGSIFFRATAESPIHFTPLSGQPDSDQEAYPSSSSSSLSGSESPVLDFSRRLPIFSRLSISDD